MIRTMKNLFDNIPADLPQELLTDILSGKHFRVERIVSDGHHSPEDFWYNQDEHEWVLVIHGEAGLQIEGEGQPRHLKTGDCLNIPAHCRHRVAWTSTTEKTIWLAIFYL